MTKNRVRNNELAAAFNTSIEYQGYALIKEERQTMPEPEQPFDLQRQLEMAERLVMHTLTQRRLTSTPKTILIPLDALLEFPDFADFVLDQPDDARTIVRTAIDKMDLPLLEDKASDRNNLDVIFLDVPESNSLRLSQIGHEHLNRLYSFDAILSKMSELHTRMTLIKYECPSCAQIIPVAQPAMGRRMAPSACMCGRKGKFHVLHTERINTRFVSFEEPVDIVDSQMNPVKKAAVLNNSMASPEIVKAFPPGSRVKVIGIPREVEQVRKEGGIDVVAKFYIECVYVIPLQDDTLDTFLTDADRARCLEIARDVNNSGMGQILESYSPYVYGNNPIKEALLLMACSGRNTPRPGELKISRKNIHILLVGDTGTAKTTLAKSLQLLVPRTRFALGAGQSSGAGLIGAVEKDTTFGMGWSLEAGQLVLAHNSICIVDEIDKMDEEDYNNFLEVMEDQSVTINKATIKQTMMAWTGVLGIANPKGGRFDVYKPLAEQIGMPAYLLNRFDLIITLLDVPDAKRDAATVQTMMDMQLDISSGNQRSTPLSQEELCKYIIFVRQRPNPSFMPQAVLALKEFYLGLRSQYKQTHQVPINARVMESIQRLSVSYARIRLSDKVEALDAERACALYTEIMQKVLTDVYTGNTNIDLVDNPTTTLERMRKVMLTLEEHYRNDLIPVVDAIAAAAKINISEADALLFLKKLDYFSPKPDYLRRY